MIVRAWRGSAATAADGDAYVRHLRESVFPEIADIPGHLGAELLRAGDDFLVLTRWTSMDAVRAFAGDSPELAVVEPAARAVLTEFDTHVTHYDVALPS
jgi:heme-degrading monooxygenase HmoA